MRRNFEENYYNNTWEPEYRPEPRFEHEHRGHRPDFRGPRHEFNRGPEMDFDGPRPNFDRHEMRGHGCGFRGPKPEFNGRPEMDFGGPRHDFDRHEMRGHGCGHPDFNKEPKMPEYQFESSDVMKLMDAPDDVFAPLSEEEKDQLLSLLKKLNAAADPE